MDPESDDCKDDDMELEDGSDCSSILRLGRFMITDSFSNDKCSNDVILYIAFILCQNTSWINSKKME